MITSFAPHSSRPLARAADVLVRSAFPHVVVAGACAGFAGALAVRPPALGWAFAAAFAIGALALEARLPRVVALVLAAALGGWWWAGVRLAALDASVLAGQIGDAAPAVIETTGPARRGLYSIRIPAQARQFDRSDVDEPVLLELPRGRAPPQGAILSLVAEVRAPRPSDGRFDERAWLRRQGAHVVLRASRWSIVGHRGGLGGVADRLRARLERSLSPGLRGERRAVVAGVVLGADEGLSSELRDRFRASGLYHLLAVSGQNVAFIAGGMLIIAWLLRLPRWLGEVGALAANGAYLLAVGLQPSVVRAGIAGALASLAWLVARPRDRWYFLLVGAAALLAWNPYNALEPGFQLSFGAVLAIFLLVPRIERVLEGYPIPKLVATTVAVSLACGIATAPILLLQFGRVPVYSVVSNALAAPVVAPLLGLALVAAALEPVLPGAAAALAWVNGWLAAYLAACARVVGGLPHAQVSSRAVLVAAAAVVTGGLGVRRFRSGRRGSAAVVAALALAGGIGWQLRPHPAPPPPPTGFRLTFLDVGQGDAALLEVPEGAVLVDEGPPEAHVDRQLRRLGIRRLAAIVLTHPQRDHVGGAEEVLEALPVGFVLDPRLPSSSLEERDAIAAARRRGVEVISARAGQVYRLGDLTIRVLWPDGPGPPGEDPNERAIVVLASYGSVDALLAADAESHVVLPLRPPPVEILKVSHHGSADEQLPTLLRLVHPAVAVISVGAGNDYGHPAPSTVSALAGSPGLRVLRTDRDGRIVVESDGRRLSATSER
jgi:competence protein ComEC